MANLWPNPLNGAGPGQVFLPCRGPCWLVGSLEALEHGGAQEARLGDRLPLLGQLLVGGGGVGGGGGGDTVLKVEDVDSTRGGMGRGGGGGVEPTLLGKVVRRANGVPAYWGLGQGMFGPSGSQCRTRYLAVVM